MLTLMGLFQPPWSGQIAQSEEYIDEEDSVGASDSKSLQGFGFLTAVENDELGWIGGLLILNASSRPLEFHCTAPVKPSRAQRILYGPTLASYVCGDLIGAALTKKASAHPELYFTDSLSMLAVRPLIDAPVVCLEGPDSASQPQVERSHIRIDNEHADKTGPHTQATIPFQFQNRQMLVDGRFATDQQSAAAILERGHALDLDEPFQRICEALEETQLRKR